MVAAGVPVVVLLGFRLLGAIANFEFDSNHGIIVVPLAFAWVASAIFALLAGVRRAERVYNRYRNRVTKGVVVQLTVLGFGGTLFVAALGTLITSLLGFTILFVL